MLGLVESLLVLAVKADCPPMLPCWTDGGVRPVLCTEDIDEDGRVMERHYFSLDLAKDID